MPETNGFSHSMHLYFVATFKSPSHCLNPIHTPSRHIKVRGSRRGQAWQRDRSISEYNWIGSLIPKARGLLPAAEMLVLRWQGALVEPRCLEALWEALARCHDCCSAFAELCRLLHRLLLLRQGLFTRRGEIGEVVGPSCAPLRSRVLLFYILQWAVIAAETNPCLPWQLLWQIHLHSTFNPVQ